MIKITSAPDDGFTYWEKQKRTQARLEVPIVESGDGYNQPYPRPFMNEARDEYVDSGEAGHDLIAALESAGFTS